jgi:hypothetical protein
MEGAIDNFNVRTFTELLEQSNIDFLGLEIKGLWNSQP